MAKFETESYIMLEKIKNIYDKKSMAARQDIGKVGKDPRIRINGSLLWIRMSANQQN